MSVQHTLIRTNGVMLPGGYVFHDPITGKTYSDRHTLFPGRVIEIIRDRKANSRLFTDNRFIDPTHVAHELSVQNCTRLKNNPLHCTNGLPPVNQPVDVPAVVVKGRTCRYCGGTEMTEIICQVCSGRKVTGYHCVKCGKDNKK